MSEETSRRTLLGMIGTAFAALPASRLLAATKPPAIERIELRTATGRMSQVTYWRAKAARGTILFSHGALSSPAKYDPLILPWVAAGFDVWAPLHVDSTDHPDTRSFPGLTSWRARIEDMRALSDHIGGGSHIAAGHSYGALTALVLGGASAVVPEGISGPMRDVNAKLVVAFSPPGRAPGLIDGAGYATLAVPAFIQTGTKDIPPSAPGTPIDPDAWKGHQLAYEIAKAGGDRYLLVLDGVDHYFGGLICRPDLPGPRQSTQLEQATRLSLQFMQGLGFGSAHAHRMLDASLSNALPLILMRK